MKKRIIAFLLLISLLISTAVLSSCNIDGNLVGTVIIRNGKSNILSLGDSIAAGTALPGYNADKPTDSLNAPNQAFSYLLAQKLQLGTANMAVEGYQTKDVLNQLNTNATCIDFVTNRAKIVTLSIGANDIFTPALEMVKTHLGIDDANIRTENELLLKHFEDYKNYNLFEILGDLVALSELLTTDEAKEVLQNGVKTFKQNFPSILETIRTYNPDAEIYVTSIHNPLEGFISVQSMGVTLGSTAKYYIDQLNAFLQSLAASGDIVLVDCSALSSGTTTDEDGNTVGYLNVKIDIVNAIYSLDPHPNAYGHQYIADRIEEAYNARH